MGHVPSSSDNSFRFSSSTITRQQWLQGAQGGKIADRIISRGKSGVRARMSQAKANFMSTKFGQFLSKIKKSIRQRLMSLAPSRKKHQTAEAFGKKLEKAMIKGDALKVSNMIKKMNPKFKLQVKVKPEVIVQYDSKQPEGKKLMDLDMANNAGIYEKSGVEAYKAGLDALPASKEDAGTAEGFSRLLEDALIRGDSETVKSMMSEMKPELSGKVKVNPAFIMRFDAQQPLGESLRGMDREKGAGIYDKSGVDGYAADAKQDMVDDRLEASQLEMYESGYQKTMELLEKLEADSFVEAKGTGETEETMRVLTENIEKIDKLGELLMKGTSEEILSVVKSGGVDVNGFIGGKFGVQIVLERGDPKILDMMVANGMKLDMFYNASASLNYREAGGEQIVLKEGSPIEQALLGHVLEMDDEMYIIGQTDNPNGPYMNISYGG